VEQRLLKGSLGNLLLLDRVVNTIMSNHPYPQKRDGIESQMDGRGYRHGSYSEIKVAKDTDDDWTKDSILARGRKLLKWMEGRWLKWKKNEDHQWNIQFTDADLDTILGIARFEK